MKVLALLRAPQFSPNSEANDRAILTAVACRLRAEGHEVQLFSELALTEAAGWCARPPLVLSMSRLPATLAWLEACDGTVVNRPEAVSRCARSLLDAAMQRIGTPRPPSHGDLGYWLKRGDAAAQSKDDVVFACDEAELKVRMADFDRRGIGSRVVQAHVAGDLVKFYGVRGTPFFRYFYPADDGLSKFGDERRNGPARHYAFPVAALSAAANALADAVDLDVYGGDAIVRPDGTFCLIDFNDWPSFSRCRDEAADAIATLLFRKLQKITET